MIYKDFIEDGLQHDRIFGIPYTANDVDAYKAALAYDAHELLRSIDNNIVELNRQIQGPCELKMTNTRLKHIRESFTVQKRKLSPVFRSLGTGAIEFSEPNRYLSQRKTGHLLMAGYSYIFRDWAWGEKEVLTYLEIIRNTIKDIHAERILTLGSGACRLPYELHRWLKPTYSLCVDINPFLLYCADRVLKGEKLELMELPVVPVGINAFAPMTQIALAGETPSVSPDAFELLVHDLTEWGFRAASFDCIVTPWFIDVSSMRPRDLFSRINRTLTPGGLWINFGPVGFVNNVLKHYYSKEEIKAIVKQCGFEIVSESFGPVPYLQDPNSGHWRIEHAYCFLAKKVADVPHVAALPDEKLATWIEDPSLPIDMDIPADEMIRSFEFASALLRGVQAGKSIDDLTAQARREFGVPAEMAHYLVSSMLFQWQEGLRYNPLKE